MSQPTSRSVFTLMCNVVWWLVVTASVVVYGIAVADVWSDGTRRSLGEPLGGLFDDGYFSLRPGELAAMQDLGLNATAYAGFLVLRHLFFFGASLVIAWVIWRQVRTWVALYVTLFLVTGNFMVLLDGVPDFGPFSVLLPGIGFVSLIGLLYVYPDGRHARLFVLLLGGGAAAIATGVVLVGEQFFWEYSIFPVLAIMAGGLLAQLHRIRSEAAGVGARHALLVTYTLVIALMFATDYALPERADAGLVELVWRLAIEGAVLAVPLAVGLVIVWQVFRHGLWDVELAIHRTAVYATLSALLAFVYVLAVVMTQAVLRSVTGIDRGNTFGVITATALTALIVLPAQRRIQAGIDRVFFRRRYDLAQTLTSFSERVESRENLDEVAGDLVAIVDDTFQPALTVLFLPRSVEDRS